MKGKRLFKAIALSGLLLLIYAFTFVRSLGGPSLNWDSFTLGKVKFDGNGIPTIEAVEWNRLSEIQGYVTASDRLWQMDLMRRSAAGRLSEWFGARPESIRWDFRRKEEDWEGVADNAAAQLPTEEKAFCEAYAQGVNRFITEHPRRVGVEYFLLRTSPEPWSCRDSLLILLAMAENLTTGIDKDILRTKWNRYLDSEWQNFLFPNEHPWNIPLFGKKNGRLSTLPKLRHFPHGHSPKKKKQPAVKTKP